MRCFAFFLLVAGSVFTARSWADEAPKEDLKQFQGTWKYVSMVADGVKVPESLFRTARLTVEGDRFTAKDPFTTYKGVVKLGLNQTPKTIELDFVEGPERGNVANGIYKIEGDKITICLGLTGKPRPTEFVSKPGSGHVLEVLQQEESAMDDLKQMEGTWTMTFGEEDGKELPADVVKTATLVITGNKHEVRFGTEHIVGTQTLDAGKQPKTIDSNDTEGRFKGQTTLGIYELKGAEFKVCFALPGKERPKEFATKSGTGTILHVWKRVEQE